jgi:hypothetical protein
MHDRLTRLVLVGLLVLLAILVGQPYIDRNRKADAGAAACT